MLLVVLGLAGVPVWPAAVVAPAQAAGPDCVALVVDPAPGGAHTSCVTWTAGITGLGVLRAGHSVQFRPSDGLICRIDGVPATCTADSTHYWSYWHRPGGGASWAYSNAGAATYHPARNSTEGWAYEDGGSRQPANIAFTTICPPPAPPPRSTSSAPHRTPPPPVTRATSRPPAGPGGRSTGPAGSLPAPSSTAAPRTSAAAGTPSETTTAIRPAGPTDSPGASAPPPVVPVAAQDRGGGVPIGALLGLLLVAAVAGTGVWFTRARRAGRE